MYIHERENWLNFVWDYWKISSILASERYLQGRLPGHMERPGFDLIERATTVDELKEFEQEYSKDRGK